MALLQAHRGVSSEYPENTMAAFRASVEQGYHLIELDPKHTLDGKFVILHDKTLTRTARDADGNAPDYAIKDITLEQAQQYEYGSWFAPEFKGEPLPLLSDVLDFAEQHPDETLIVVTSDHETGGMTLGWDHYEIRMNILAAQKTSALQVTKTIQRMREEGVRDWSAYKRVLSDNFGLWSVVPVTKEEEALLKHDFYEIFLKYGPMVDGLYNKNEFITYHALRILNRHASLDWTSLYHTGMYTPLFVNGVGEEAFLECRDQTDIPKTIASLMGGQL